MNITEVMTTNVESCTLKSSCSDVAMKMKELEVGSMPICDDERLVGIVTDRDIVIKGIANNLSGETSISKLMTEDVIKGTPDMSVEQAAQIMSQYQIRRLPIVEDDKLVGMVSLGDLAVHHESTKKAGKALEDISVPAEPNQ
ncbi:CBS domain-containing protein YhcV [Bacillus sp. SA1-12]|uniref:CBS domain-containing protein n=1 Tax=Bacillus sp. SA1-12 TaxID=1455638 RepID=UPI0006269822|nr:CBS domain-containing protein [Bacillus sp. SA1-12]KKI92898.1 CBS domain-containing protein YhcV [Bacillus sp. SA1-12]